MGGRWKEGRQGGKALPGSTRGCWQHPMFAVPQGFGCVLYKVGGVLNDFQKEEEKGFGHALIKGDFLCT